MSDANLLLGRIHPDHFLGGAAKLDLERTRSHMERQRGPLASVEEFASGILRIAEIVMAQAIRVISVERGHDPREFTLIAFGGAGPLHACALAEELGMPRVMVPTMPGALSALGILLADSTREYSKTVMCSVDADLDRVFQELEAQAEPGERVRSLDLRYAGQGYELRVPARGNFVDLFHAAHEQRYGYADRRRPVEVVTVRVRVRNPGEVVRWKQQPQGDGDPSQAALPTRPVYFDGRAMETPIYARERLEVGDRLAGPAIVTEYSATTVVPTSWKLHVDSFSNLILERNR